MDSREAARRWAAAWKRGWETHDVELIACLYAPGAPHRSLPFRELEEGGAPAYTRWAFADELSAKCWFGEPVVSGDRAIVEWWAVSTTHAGETIIAGVSLLRFDRDGLVVDQRDYWSSEPGTRKPYPGFGE